MKKNFEILHNEHINKSTAFTKEERERLGLRGLLPYAVSSQTLQIKRVLDNLRRKENDLEKYLFLAALLDRNERLFYKTIITHIDEMLPLIYTPTVGQACREFSHIFTRTRGFYITPEDKGEISKILDNWQETDIRIIVITDGQRILGLGDLGANGMGIPIGKTSLYTAFAGIHPNQCLPVMLDIGTNNQRFLNDPQYLGYPHRRLEGKEYFEIVEEFVNAVQEKYPKAIIQFEDFLTPNAYALLRKYKNRVLCFNDDIQGTAAMALGGVYASTRITGKAFADLNIMFLGAGSAATGIADLLVMAFQREGLSKKEAVSRLSFVDVNGLLVSGRDDLMEHNLPYVLDYEKLDLIESIDFIKPNILIGATGVGGTFNETVIRKMSAVNERPVIFALSNPTSSSECTAEQAYTWSRGKAVFASGSPFDNVMLNGRVFQPAQANNAYIFPGIGLGATVCEARLITDDFFLIAARVLSEFISEDELSNGSLYPELQKIRDLSLAIAVEIAGYAYDKGLAQNAPPENIVEFISNFMYDPSY